MFYKKLTNNNNRNLCRTHFRHEMQTAVVKVKNQSVSYFQETIKKQLLSVKKFTDYEAKSCQKFDAKNFS